MATGVHDGDCPKETDALLSPTWKDRDYYVKPLRTKDGYDRRRQIERQGSYNFSNHRTFLSLSLQDPCEYVHINDVDVESALDNSVSQSLHDCRRQVLYPYMRLLQLVGWLPIFDASCWKKRVINILYPLFVVSLILASFLVQVVACSLGLYPNHDNQTKTTTESPGTACASSLDISPRTFQWPRCSRALEQYWIPYFFHLLAYAYSFYMLRICRSEQLQTLMERVFLHTSTVQRGSLSQKKLIRNIRFFLYAVLVWVILSLIAQSIVAYDDYFSGTFQLLSDRTGGRVCLVILMMFGFLALDLVYTVVVINYCVQCSLLIFYIAGLQDKIRQKYFDLQRAIQEMYKIEKHLRALNMDTATSLGIVLINFATMLFIVITPPIFVEFLSPLDHAIIALYIVLWITILLVPLIQAARVTAGCNSLRKLGHEIRVRPFAYKDTPDQELDTFLLFTSSLNMRAKICQIPVKSSYLCGVLLCLTVTCLVLFCFMVFL